MRNDARDMLFIMIYGRISFECSRGHGSHRNITFLSSRSIPFLQETLQLLMPDSCILKRRKPNLIPISKLLIDQPNTSRNHRQLLLPPLPLPLNLLDLIRLKNMKLNRHRRAIRAGMQRSSSLRRQSKLALFAVDGPSQGRFAGEGLAGTEASEERSVLCGQACDGDEVGDVCRCLFDDFVGLDVPDLDEGALEA